MIKRIVTDVLADQVQMLTGLAAIDGGTMQRQEQEDGKVTLIVTFPIDLPGDDAAPGEPPWMPVARAQKLDPVDVEGQPLAANAQRLMEALQILGSPLPAETATPLQAAAKARDARKIQELLDPQVLIVVTLNPEARVKAARGPAPAALQQSGFVPVLIKVVNDSTVQQSLQISSPQSGRVYSGGFAGNDPKADKNRFLQAEMFTSPPLTDKLSGLKVEYALALLYSSEAGKREATLAFDAGQGAEAKLWHVPSIKGLAHLAPKRPPAAGKHSAAKRPADKGKAKKKA